MVFNCLSFCLLSHLHDLPGYWGSFNSPFKWAVLLLSAVLGQIQRSAQLHHPVQVWNFRSALGNVVRRVWKGITLKQTQMGTPKSSAKLVFHSFTFWIVFTASGNALTGFVSNRKEESSLLLFISSGWGVWMLKDHINKNCQVFPMDKDSCYLKVPPLLQQEL